MIPEKFLEVTGTIKKVWFPRQGYTSEVVIVLGDNGTYAVKKAVGKRYGHYLKKEIKVLNSLQATDLPIPKVYGFTEAEDNYWALFQHIPGQTLREALKSPDKLAKPQLIYNFGKILARIHNTACPVELQSHNIPWLDYMLLEAEKNLWNNKTEGTAEKLRVLKKTKPENVKQTLIHGDFTIDNVIVDNGEVTGIIDWGDGCLGDPRYDLALATRPKVGTFLVQEEVDLFFEGYGGEALDEGTAAFFGNDGLYAFF